MAYSFFLDFWLQLPGVMIIIRNWLYYVGGNMSSSFCIVTKLRHLKILLKEWNKWHVGNLDMATNRLEAV